MAAVGAEVTGSWFLSSGVVTFFIVLLLLSIFLAALCTDCKRRTFELRDPETDKDAPGLVRVVRLEEAMGARVNPMIDQIQNDEKGNVSVPSWRSHLGAPPSRRDVQTNGSAAVMKTEITGGSNSEEENSAPITPWRSHLRAPQSQDVSGSAPPHGEHIYHVIGGEQSSADVSSPPTNHEPAAASALGDQNSVYARVSKKVRPTSASVDSPEEAQAEAQVEVEVEEEEVSPPLPDRTSELEG